MDNDPKSKHNDDEAEMASAVSEATLNRIYIVAMTVLLSMTGFLISRELNHFSSSLEKLTEVVQEIRFYQVELRNRLDRLEERLLVLEKRNKR